MSSGFTTRMPCCRSFGNSFKNLSLYSESDKLSWWISVFIWESYDATGDRVGKWPQQCLIDALAFLNCSWNTDELWDWGKTISASGHLIEPNAWSNGMHRVSERRYDCVPTEVRNFMEEKGSKIPFMPPTIRSILSQHWTDHQVWT